MFKKSNTLKFLNVNKIIFTKKKNKEGFLFILVKNFFLEIGKIILSNRKIIISVSKFYNKILNVLVLKNFKENKFDLVLLDNTQTISIIRLTKKLDFKIISSKNLLAEFSLDKSYSIFMVISTESFTCVLSTTGGIKLFLRIGKHKENDKLRFFNKGTKTIQQLLICYYIIYSEDNNKKFFVAIESLKFLPYSRFLVFYKYSKNGSIRKKIFSRIDRSSYLVIPIPTIKEIAEKLIVLSKGKLSIINYRLRNQISDFFPMRVFKKKFLQISIITFCFFKGKSKIIFFFINKEGDLFILNYFSDKFIGKYPLKVGYFDSLPEKTNSIKVLPNGIFYAKLETGKVLFYRFTSIKNIENQRMVFIPHIRTKHLILVDELCLITKISSIINGNDLDKYSKQLVFFCSTKNHSSIRLLEKICNIMSIFNRSLKYRPVGLYIIEVIDESVQFFISFKMSTLSFSINKKMEELNYLKIIIDLKTISIVYSKYLKGVLQITNKTIRFLKFNNKHRKICQWITGKDIFIIESVQNVYSKSYIFLLLSSSKIILMEIDKNDKFLELKSWRVEQFEKNHFILNFYFSSEQIKSKFLIIGTKKERMIRIYQLQPDLSIVLIGVQVLTWSPESIMIFKEKKNVFFLLGLNNGILLKLFFCSKKKRIIFLEFLNLSIYPLYFPENFYPLCFFVFSDKVWKVNNNSLKDLNVRLVCNKSFDLFESLGKFMVIIKEKSLMVLFYPRKSKIYLSKSRFYFNFTVTKSCWTIKKDNKFILTVNKDNFSILCDHGMNLFPLIKEKNKGLIKRGFQLKDYGSSISVLEIWKNQNKAFLNNLNLKDLFLLTTSTGHCFFDSIIKKKSSIPDDNIFVITRIFCSDYTHKKGVISPINEYHSQNFSIISLTLKNFSKFSSIIGGKYSQALKLNFLYEHSMNYQSINSKISFLSNFFIGSRLVIFLEKGIVILEIKKENFNIIQFIEIPTLNFKKTYILGNILYFTEGLQELKIFVFSNKEKWCSSICIPSKFSINDFFIFNPVYILTKDMMENFYFFKISKNKFGFLLKKENSFKINLLLKFNDVIKTDPKLNHNFINEIFFI